MMASSPDVHLARGSETTTEQRKAFFSITHPGIAAWLVPHWHWWFRLGFRADIEPIVAVARDRIVGHAGSMPFAFRYGAKRDVAVWYTVFAVLPEWQGRGLGKRLTEEWMRLQPNPITQCNEKSIAIFKKYGWQETFASRRFACVADPATLAGRLPGPLRMAVPLGRPLYRAWMKWSARSGPRLQPEPLPTAAGAFAGLFQPETEDSLELLRDDDWVRWRVLDSPFVADYRLFRFESATVLVRGMVSDGIRRLHILYVNRPARTEHRSMLLRGIVRWACEDRADLIWAVARSAELGAALREALPNETGVRIAAHNFNREVMAALLDPGFQIQAMDSDLDLSYAPDPGATFRWE
jgi:GNAT superfamily N-acetyltransferase